MDLQNLSQSDFILSLSVTPFLNPLRSEDIEIWSVYVELHKLIHYFADNLLRT